MIENSEAGEERKRLERRKLDALLGYCESMRCRRQVLLANFGEEYTVDRRRLRQLRQLPAAGRDLGRAPSPRRRR